MNLQRISRLLIVAVVPAIAGLLFTLQTNLDKDTAKIPLPPGIITPGEQDSGQLSIVPGEKDTTKIEYRNIVFSRDNALQSQGSAGNMVSEEGRFSWGLGSLREISLYSDQDQSREANDAPSQGIENDMSSPDNNVETDTGEAYPMDEGPMEMDNNFQDESE